MNTKERENAILPATDILERSEGFHIFMDMPGVAPDALSIDLEENELMVTGASRYTPASETQGRYSAPEFGAPVYRRVFTLSDMVDRERIKASLKDGVLDLFLPKAEAMKPRRIPISSGELE